MAHKIQVHIEEENRKSLTFFGESDSRDEVLLKHYESLMSYNKAFTELLTRIMDYRK